ncbi:peroxisome biogenesis protein 6 [Ipomoea triloba]|uniref:peroxisome biogenesis protein 6 n=1 Tax=Ipomoea triloba TaxID=35885 RepID=UPI00125E1277|nr:peroxisome biogenesis protein 6 [Ipomoea triloba]XP_031100513.1 peroxisome biogenesis protein 6 [Ipomoea triloba]
MARKRKPLILSSTKAHLTSIFNDEHKFKEATKPLSSSSLTNTSIQLRAGILQLPKDLNGISPTKAGSSLDCSTMVGLSTSSLKRLSITSGSLVLIKNVDMSGQRIGQVIVLDPPHTDKALPSSTPLLSESPQAMLVLPSHCYGDVHSPKTDEETAYLSPILGFNLNLHISCLKSVIHLNNETLSPLLDIKVESGGSGNESAVISLGIEPLDQLPKYATHLRASFVKIPECGMLESVRRTSLVEAEDRQELIDLALNQYFSVDRFLARGDLFSVSINWNCKSALCVPCTQKLQTGGSEIVYFKVVAMEPSEEPFLRANRVQTALVLGGNAPSAIPADFLIPGPQRFLPLQANSVKTLASILMPALCPSPLSSKFRVAVLLSGSPGIGKTTMTKFVARRLGLHVVEYSCHNLFLSSERKASAVLAQAFSTARRYSPTILLLRHFDVLSNLVSHEGSAHEQLGVNLEVASVIKEFTEPIGDEDLHFEENLKGDDVARRTSGHPVLFIAAADSSEGLPPTIRRCFSHEISMAPLTEEQRKEMMSQSLQRITAMLPNASTEDFIKDIVGQTSGFMPRDLRALIADAGASLISSQNIKHVKSEPENLNKTSLDTKPVENDGLVSPSQVLSKEDLMKSMERSKKRNASALGTPKVPDVKWEDVGGLEDVKKSILDTVQLPLLHKDLFSSGLRKRSGVLLYGPPGTGKTLLAKAVATECSLNFLSVKGPELINMYIGESEKNVRDIFQKARSARPCVIFFDELDSLAPARGASGDSGGVMDRVVSQMLAEIDGLNDSTQDLFIIGASNRPDLIDPALLRPGRLDKLLYVGVNSEASYREGVLKALTRKFKLHEHVSLLSIAKKCPPNFTGADMYALCADAWFHAAKRKALAIGLDSNGSGDTKDAIVIEYDDFMKVLSDLSPSLSMAELKKYEALRDQYEGASASR